MSATERDLAIRFREVVLAKRPVLVLADRVDGRVDPHHVIRRQTIEKFDPFRDLEPEELWLIAWDPDNGVPICRLYHDQITVGYRRLLASELRPENVAFAERNGLLHKLVREVPSFNPDGYRIVDRGR